MARLTLDKRRVRKLEMELVSGAPIDCSALSHEQRERLEAWRRTINIIGLVDGASAAYEYSMRNPIPRDIGETLLGEDFIKPDNNADTSRQKYTRCLRR